MKKFKRATKAAKEMYELRPYPFNTHEVNKFAKEMRRHIVQKALTANKKEFELMMECMGA